MSLYISRTLKGRGRTARVIALVMVRQGTRDTMRRIIALVMVKQGTRDTMRRTEAVKMSQRILRI